jgi:uncharacterized OB-fold protein
MSNFYLPEGLQVPVAESDQVAAPFWDGLRQERLRIQRCTACANWQFGPECICHRCHAFDPAWVDVPPDGTIYSWERVWHPVHAVLKDRGPYLAVLVELPQAGHVRLVGNLLGDALQVVRIGDRVRGRFEHHDDARSRPYSLLHWEIQAAAP